MAESIAAVVEPLGIERHLAMLPLATLLENIGGLYVPLWLGATACLPGMAELGWQGASGFNPQRALAANDTFRPHSLILVPQLLQALVAARPNAPESLRFVAVGGARVADTLLARARRGGWPVFEGYGLSECASVVCLNRPGEPARGVGRPLPHAEVRIDDAGKVWVRGATQLGYLGEPAPVSGWPIGFGDDDKAEWHLKRALTINPDGLDSLYFWGDYLHRQGRDAEARQALEKAMQAPSRPGRELADAGRHEEVLRLLSQLEE